MSAKEIIVPEKDTLIDEDSFVAALKRKRRQRSSKTCSGSASAESNVSPRTAAPNSPVYIFLAYISSLSLFNQLSLYIDKYDIILQQGPYPNNSIGGAGNDDVERVPLARLTEGDTQHLLRALAAADRVHRA